MCERCERNTQTKRQLADVLYRAPADGDADARAVPGFIPFLMLCRRMETLTRAPAHEGQPDPEEATLFRAAVKALSAEERSDVLRVATYVLDMAKGIQMNVATAKVELADRDATATLIVVTLEGRDIVTRVNGEEVTRITIEPDQDPNQQLDSAKSAADRAMQAHRDIHGAS